MVILLLFSSPRVATRGCKSSTHTGNGMDVPLFDYQSVFGRIILLQCHKTGDVCGLRQLPVDYRDCKKRRSSRIESLGTILVAMVNHLIIEIFYLLCATRRNYNNYSSSWTSVLLCNWPILLFLYWKSFNRIFASSRIPPPVIKQTESGKMAALIEVIHNVAQDRRQSCCCSVSSLLLVVLRVHKKFYRYCSGSISTTMLHSSGGVLHSSSSAINTLDLLQRPLSSTSRDSKRGWIYGKLRFKKIDKINCNLMKPASFPAFPVALPPPRKRPIFITWFIVIQAGQSFRPSSSFTASSVCDCGFLSRVTILPFSLNQEETQRTRRPQKQI